MCFQHLLALFRRINHSLSILFSECDLANTKIAKELIKKYFQLKPEEERFSSHCLHAPPCRTPSRGQLKLFLSKKTLLDHMLKVHDWSVVLSAPDDEPPIHQPQNHQARKIAGGGGGAVVEDPRLDNDEEDDAEGEDEEDEEEESLVQSISELSVKAIVSRSSRRSTPY